MNLLPSSASSVWAKDLAHAPRDWEALARRWGWDEARIQSARPAQELFPFRATAHYLSLADFDDPQDPILRQVLPDPKESAPQPVGYEQDAVGDLLPGNHPAPALIHKYPGRALLILTGACGVHCRYCFRRSYPYAEIRLGGRRYKSAIAALAADPSISEVILSGGDPLSLSDAVLRDLVRALEEIPHLRRLRIHSRMPVVLPARITEELLEILSSSRLRPWLVTHFNHERELAPVAVDACQRVLRAGIPVLNQSVLLAGVNDTEQAQVALQEALVDAGIKPYYLHQLDRVQGAAHFEVPQAQGIQLMKRLRERLSGIALPSYVRDQLGSSSKQALGAGLWSCFLLLGLSLGVGLSACTRSSEPVPSETEAASIAEPQSSPPASTTATERPAQLAREASDAASLTGSVDRVLSARLRPGADPTLFFNQANRIYFGSWLAGQPGPVLEGHFEGKGRLQAWGAWDGDGDGAEEVYAAFGLGRDFGEASLEIVKIQRKGKTTSMLSLWRRDGERDQVTTLAPWPRDGGGFDVYIAAFSSRFEVDGGVLPREGGSPRWLPGHRLRMGMARGVGDFDGDGKLEVAVGRLYGDEAGADGDLRVLQEGGTVEAVPTLRGVRALNVADLDGDGRDELLFGDGWHKAYAKHGRFRPSIARRGTDGAWAVELVEERSDQYSVEQIRFAEGQLFVSGPKGLLRYGPSQGGWAVQGPMVRTGPNGSFAVAGDQHVLLSGLRPSRVPLKGR